MITADHEGSLAPCQGIRPGGALILQAGPFDFVYCSMAFIVTDGTDLYVSTAGHCVEDSLDVPSLGERVAAHGVGQFGTVVHQWCEGQAANGGCGAGTDFGLIRIDADKRSFVSASMCHWGAPSGMFTAHDDNLREIRHFGWGAGLGGADVGVRSGDVLVQPGNPATQARKGVGFIFSEPDFAVAETAAISGDSGSGVLVTELPTVPGLEQPQAKALGVMTHISAGGLAFIQRMDLSLARAGTEMGRSFNVVTG
ncbi:MAG TPA: hypothetical protein VNE62_06730 [Actinomycetota bacterium]|nr:hypothetical protein [Actinomycetota bacterium]